MKRMKKLKRCLFCGRMIGANGLTSHMRGHVRKGEAKEFKTIQEADTFTKTIMAHDRQDSTSPFNAKNFKPVPDKPGVWFYIATKMPVTVIRKDDGELYFQAGKDSNEEMKVKDFGVMKAANEEISKCGFVQLQPVLEAQISAN